MFRPFVYDNAILRLLLWAPFQYHKGQTDY